MLESINIGLIQTNLDHVAAWSAGPTMSETEADGAIEEIKFALQCFRQRSPLPQIILIPELSTPRPYQYLLRRAAYSLQAVIIAGFDYRRDQRAKKRLHNEAIVFIPPNWQSKRMGGGAVSEVTVKKSEAAHAEQKALKKCGFECSTSSAFLVFNGAEMGNFGVSICSDFLDLDRAAAYRGRIQHLFVLAYNRDLDSFCHAAESLARTIYCNAVVCNTGFYGGSVAVAPLHKPWRRVIYRQAGAHLFSHQVITIPVSAIADAQSGAENPDFKSLPPRYPPNRQPLKIKTKYL